MFSIRIGRAKLGFYTSSPDLELQSDLKNVIMGGHNINCNYLLHILIVVTWFGVSFGVSFVLVLFLLLPLKNVL